MSVRTTIQVDRETVAMLEKLKREWRARSYAEVVKQLVREVKVLETSEKGSLPKLKKFQRDKLDRFS